MIDVGLRATSLVSGVVLITLALFVAPVAAVAASMSATWCLLELQYCRRPGKPCGALTIVLVEAILCVAGPVCIAIFVIESFMSSLASEAAGIFPLILSLQIIHTLSHAASLVQACSRLRNEAQPEEQQAIFSDSEKGI